MEDCLCASKSPNKILGHRQSSIQNFNPCVQVLLAGDLYERGFSVGIVPADWLEIPMIGDPVNWVWGRNWGSSFPF